VSTRGTLTRYHNWLIYSLIDPELEVMLRRYAHGRMADIGCGVKPYRAMASSLVTEHVGIDHESSLHGKAHVDVVGTAYAIPQPDASFDTVLCTDVLEHLEEPGVAIAEAHRVLKQGGVAIYTVPFFWHLHEQPRDFYRFTQYGLKYLFERNHFEVLELKALSGFCATFGQELAYFLQQLRGQSRLNPLWWILPPIVLLVQGIAYLLNKIDRSKNFTIEYIIAARKP
jgi:SAM-dependent methyltransferase